MGRGCVSFKGKVSLTVGYDAWYGKSIPQPLCYRETGKVSQPQRFFSVPGNTTLRLGETDIGVCRHNLQEGLSHSCKCVSA